MAELTLALDASTYEGSVAVIRDSVVVVDETVAMRGKEEERLMPAVVRALEHVGARPRDLTRIVCGAGPGSFTSLRIAAAIAKGLASGTGASLYAVPSLALAAIEAGEGRWLVSLDAMRGESYAVCYAWSNNVLTLVRDVVIIATADLASLATELDATVVNAAPRARAVAQITDAIVDNGPVDLASWEPDYGRRAEAQVRWEAAHGTPLVP